MKNIKNVIDHIVKELKTYCEKSQRHGFVIGVSGGIDSAVVSKLCAMTGLPTLGCLIKVDDKMSDSDKLAWDHLHSIQSKFPKFYVIRKYLTETLRILKTELPVIDRERNDSAGLFLVNAISRLRMLTLYAFAGDDNLLVVGTGNKVEDFGVGFFTKYGDGGVDISPIADLMKSEVYEIGKFLGIHEDIMNAKPTDGLWEDGRTDEDQIGASYGELEWAMNWNETKPDFDFDLPDRQIEVLQIYRNLNNKNKHKMIPIPIITISDELKG